MSKQDNWGTIQNLNQVIRFNDTTTITGTDGNGIGGV